MRDEIVERQAELEERHWWFVGRREILLEVSAALLPPERAGLVIDVGCGTGGNVGALSERYRAVGIDSSSRALELARARHPRVRFVLGDQASLAGQFVEPGCLVLLNDVLEHVPDDFRFFSELLAPLPAGTTLILTVPAGEHLWSPHDVALSHYRRYEVERLRRVWSGLPVRELLVTPFNSRLYLAARVRRLFTSRWNTATRSVSDLEVLPGLLNRVLARWFAGERIPIRRALATGGRPPYRRGVSLLAVLTRLPGAVSPRNRPPEVAPDRHNPAAR